MILGGLERGWPDYQKNPGENNERILLIFPYCCGNIGFESLVYVHAAILGVRCGF